MSAICISGEVFMLRVSVCNSLAACAFCVLAVASANSQTVTTPGGSTNNIPYFTGSTTLGNSPITFTGGNVGIAQASPQFTLDIAGDVNVSIGQAYRYAGTPIIQANPDLFNYFLGGGGNSTTTGHYNLTLGARTFLSNTTGDGNIALGTFTLQQNTTGSYNVAVGSSALMYNTTGWGNTALGNQGLQHNVNGFANTSVGFAAFANNTAGFVNTSIGAYSLFSADNVYATNALGVNSLVNLTSGTDNTAVGDGAGDDTLQQGSSSVVPFTTGSYNTYLGASTLSLADNDTNETVIGAGAIGGGSNSVSLGNQNVQTTLLHGNVILSPGGQITFPDGSILRQAPSPSGTGTGGGTTPSNGNAAVTTPGGSATALPKFLDAATLGSSTISEGPSGVNINNTAAINYFSQKWPGVQLSLFNTSGIPEYNSVSTILFAGGNRPDGFARIWAGGTDPGGGNGYIAFGTTLGGQIEQQVTISPHGNVGIGTATPTGELSIALAMPGDEVGAHIANTDPTGYSVIRLGTDSQEGVGGAIHATGTAYQSDPAGAAGPYGPGVMNMSAWQAGGLSFVTASSSAPIRFFTGGTTGANERMHLDPTGRLGVGTTSPSQALEVNGSIMISTGSSGGIIFPDGTTQRTAAGTGNSPGTTTTGSTTTISNPTGNAGIQFDTTAQAIGGAFGPGGALLLRANSVTDTANTGGYIQLGGSARGDSSINKVLIGGNSNPGQPLGTVGIVVNGSNNVGIGIQGSSDPATRLEVNGNITLTAGSGASMTFADGTVQATAWNGVLHAGDYAEAVDVTGDRSEYDPGDVISLDPAHPGRFIKAAQPYSRLVTGVYSTKPALVGRRATTPRIDESAEIPMAMIGIVPIKVTDENGPIEPGDLLVSSSTAGYAMRGSDTQRLQGAVLGKSLGECKSAKGVLEVVLTLQ